MNKNEKELVDFSRQLLDDSLNELDDSVLSRLRQSRQLAINAALETSRQNAPTPAFTFPNWLAPVSTGAAFATIALSVSLFWTQPMPNKIQGNGFIENITLLSQSEELELYQNLEFYLWLEDESTS